MMFFLLDSDLLWLGEYTVGSANIRVVNSSGEIMCSNVTPTNNHTQADIIASVIGTIALLLFGILILIFLRYRWKRRSKMYRIMNSDPECTSGSNTELIEQPDEVNPVTA